MNASCDIDKHGDKIIWMFLIITCVCTLIIISAFSITASTIVGCILTKVFNW